jgi:hypothetical protein
MGTNTFEHAEFKFENRSRTLVLDPQFSHKLLFYLL